MKFRCAHALCADDAKKINPFQVLEHPQWLNIWCLQNIKSSFALKEKTLTYKREKKVLRILSEVLGMCGWERLSTKVGTLEGMYDNDHRNLLSIMEYRIE